MPATGIDEAVAELYRAKENDAVGVGLATWPTGELAGRGSEGCIKLGQRTELEAIEASLIDHGPIRAAVH